MNKLILGLGGNSGDVNHTLKIAIEIISQDIGTIVKKSSNYKTAAWGNTNQPDFINNVLLVETDLSVEICLLKVMKIEKQLGRVRTEKKWEERVIDIDILFYNQVILNRDNLSVPHPFIHQRKFVLVPLVEIVPNYIHPLFKVSLNVLLKSCSDVLDVQKV